MVGELSQSLPKVLVVDDDPSIVSVLTRVLSFQYDLSTATSGREALLKLAEEGPFSVVMTDLRMPGMDGVQLIREARAVASDAVFLVLTGNQDEASMRYIEREAAPFRTLNKPCMSADIRTAIAEAHGHFLASRGGR